MTSMTEICQTKINLKSKFQTPGDIGPLSETKRKLESNDGIRGKIFSFISIKHLLII